MGKGSWRRPGSLKQYSDNWDRIFKKGKQDDEERGQDGEDDFLRGSSGESGEEPEAPKEASRR